jgi:hypothetical protein
MKENLKDFIEMWKFYNLIFAPIALILIPIMVICSLIQNDYTPILWVSMGILGAYLFINFVTFILSLFGLSSMVDRGSCG